MSHCATLSRAAALAIPVTLGAWTVQAADLIQTAEQVGRFNGFLGLLEAAGMADMLKREGPFTVFAPTDEAFAQLPPGTLDRLLAEDELLQKAVQSQIGRLCCRTTHREGRREGGRGDEAISICVCRIRLPKISKTKNRRTKAIIPRIHNVCVLGHSAAAGPPWLCRDRPCGDISLAFLYTSNARH
jgi:Fasciclin domain